LPKFGNAELLDALLSKFGIVETAGHLDDKVSSFCAIYSAFIISFLQYFSKFYGKRL